MRFTRKAIQEIRARWQKAIGGIWTLEHYTARDDGDRDIVVSDCEPPYGGRFVCGARNHRERSFDEWAEAINTLEFIAYAHQDIPVLLDAVEESLAHAKEIREMRKALKESTENVVLFLGHIDKIMRTEPSTVERGQKIAALCNAMDMANDMIRYGALGIDYRTDDKQRIINRRISKQSTGAINTKERV